MSRKYIISDAIKCAKERGFEFLSLTIDGTLKLYPWRCKKCGFEWTARFSHIKNKTSGCPKCSKHPKLTYEDMLLTAAEAELEFLSPVYTRCIENHKWRCLKCRHEWQAPPNNIRRGHGCPKCAKVLKKTISDMHDIAKARGFKFLSTEYKGIDEKYLWQCPNGHKWPATGWSVKAGSGCPRCTHFVNEERCRFIFESLTTKEFPQNRTKLGNRLQLDGYCESLNLAFEYQGQQHFYFVKRWHKDRSGLLRQKRIDRKKSRLCKKKKITKIDISYLDADDNEKLEKFIRDKLINLDLRIVGKVDWSDFTRTSAALTKLKKKAAKKKIKCLSDLYVNSKTYLKFECLVCGYLWKTKPINIQQGKGCPRCGNAIKKSEKEVRDTVAKRNIELLSPYVKMTAKHDWKCLVCGNKWSALANNVYHNKSGCPDCGELKRRETSRKIRLKRHTS